MMPSLIVAFAWVLFGGSHLLLSSTAIRRWLAERYGLRGFTLIFTGITSVFMIVLIAAVAVLGDQGRAGPNLADLPVLRATLFVVSAIGAILAVGGLINYAKSPMAVLAQRQRNPTKFKGLPLSPPSAIERVARHPFFFGLSVLMGAHALLASTLSQCVYFSGFVALSVMGIALQDKKLQERWRDVYKDFQNQTANMPLVKPKMVSSEKRDPELINWGLAVIGAVVVFGLLHPVWVYANGVLFGVAILVFGLMGVAIGIRKSN